MNKLVIDVWDKTTTPTRVATILNALNRTQAQLADVLGVTFVTVNRWVNGHSVPDARSRKMLERLEDVYIHGKQSETA